MIGNDIIDLKFTQQSHWNRPRYLNKLFSQKEQQQIFNASEPSKKVWLLWSMKEAAYKLYLQTSNSKPFYNPKAFECCFENKPKVTFKEFRCEITSKITNNYIISEANTDSNEILNQSRKLSGQNDSYSIDSLLTSKVIYFEQSDYKFQSETLKHTLKNDIAKSFKTKVNNIDIKKNDSGVPFLIFENQCFNLSLTHHGNYGAYAISLQ